MQAVLQNQLADIAAAQKKVALEFRARGADRGRSDDLVGFGVSSLADSLIERMAALRDLLQEMDKRFSSVSAHVACPDESVSVPEVARCSP